MFSQRSLASVFGRKHFSITCCLFTLLLRTRKGERRKRGKKNRVCVREREKKTWGLWAVQESIKCSFLSGENVPAR